MTVGPIGMLVALLVVGGLAGAAMFLFMGRRTEKDQDARATEDLIDIDRARIENSTARAATVIEAKTDHDLLEQIKNDYGNGAKP